MSKKATVTPPQNSIQIFSKRNTLMDIKKKALERKKYYAQNVTYDAKNENDFFSIIESQIYDSIEGEKT